MKLCLPCCLLIGVAAGSIALTSVLAQTKEPPKDKAPAPKLDQTEAWMKLAELNDNHAMLKQFAGTWDATVTDYSNPAAPSVSKGTMINTMIHGNHYLQMEFSGTMMEMSFTGSGVWGYNNAEKRFESTWIDSMSTGVSFWTGSYDAATKTYSSSSECKMPDATGKMTASKMREVVKWTDATHHTMEMWGPGPDGKEVKMMQIAYAKR